MLLNGLSGTNGQTVSVFGCPPPSALYTCFWRDASRPSSRNLLSSFSLVPDSYSLTQLRYDLRKMKAHGLLERDSRRYAYRLTNKGTRTALLFVLFHQRVCGPRANTLFQRRPTQTVAPLSKLEAAYRKAEHSLDHIIQLLAA